MPSKLTSDEFIKRCQQVHGNRYKYDSTVYKGAMVYVNIICPIHGTFSMPASRHLNDRRGCFKCGHLTPAVEEFVRTCEIVHANKYNYSLVNELTKLNSHISIICDRHGEFSQLAATHIRGGGCSKCAGVSPLLTYDFINRAKLIHTNRYDYSLVEYKNSHTKIQIQCCNHGLFNQTPNGHLQGRGCPACGIVRVKDNGIYCESFFKSNPNRKDDPAIFYVLRFSNLNETFVKVGITTTSVRARYRYGYKKKYQIEPIIELRTSLHNAFIIERDIKHQFDHLRVTPMIKFRGWTECFKEKELMLSINSFGINYPTDRNVLRRLHSEADLQ